MLTMKFPLGRTGMALISAALLCACSSSNPPSNAQALSTASAPPSSSISVTTPVSSVTAPPLDVLLKKDMAYADARKLLLAHGWAPESDTDCKTNMGADDAAMCDDIPELSIYSDQGVLITHFRHAQQQLAISSYGMLSDWKVSGDGSRLRITDWRTSSTGATGKPSTP